MSKFADLLNRPLPSQGEGDVDNIVESAEEKEPMEVPEPENLGEEEVQKESGDEDDDDYSEVNDLATNAFSEEEDDEDLSDLSDEELAQLDKELTGNIDDETDNDDAVVLSPEEEKEADDMMSIAATTVLINNEMNADEKVKFLESQLDTTIAINEGLLLESDINEMAMECGIMTEANNYSKKMIIRLDKNARMKQLYALAINVCAAAHGDPDYAKKKKLMKMKKVLNARLEKKYHAEAVKRAKVYMKRLMNSKSKPLNDLGKKIQK